MARGTSQFTDLERALAQAALKANPTIDSALFANVIKRNEAASDALRVQLLEAGAPLEERPAPRPGVRPTKRPGEMVFPVIRLSQHPFNTRIIMTDSPDIAALAASIERSGQIEPLTVMLEAGASGDALVIDGARRLAALRRLGRTFVKVVLVKMAPAEVAAAIYANDRQKKRWSAYEFALYLAAIVDAHPTEAACAEAVGMSRDAFCKARAPARLPACVIAKVADPRTISGKDAATICARWNRDASAVEAAVAGLHGPVSAKQVLVALVGRGLIECPQKPTIAVPRDELLAVLAHLAINGTTVPPPLAEILRRAIAAN